MTASQLQAAPTNTYYWWGPADGSDGNTDDSGVWDTTLSNWGTSAAALDTYTNSLSNSIADFHRNYTDPDTYTITLNDTIEVYSLKYYRTYKTFEGSGKLRLGAGGIEETDHYGGITLKMDTELTADQEWTINKYLTAACSISGSGGFTGNGTGFIELKGTNTYSGDTRVITGTARIYNALSLQNTTIDRRPGDGIIYMWIKATNYIVGGLKGDGDFILRGNTDHRFINMHIGNNNTDTVFSGVLSCADGRMSFRKIGTGSISLNGNNTYGCKTYIDSGKWLVNGIHTPDLTITSANAAYYVNSGGTLGGTGSIPVNPTFVSGATLAGGDTNGFGTLTFTNGLTLVSGSTNRVTAGNLQAGEYSAVKVTGGTINLGSATLDINDANMTSLTPITIVDNQTGSAITGTFDGLNDGDNITGGRNDWTITYTGGTGDDVVLTPIAHGTLIMVQ
jgi:autotransporter-associated beta strand protein